MLAMRSIYLSWPLTRSVQFSHASQPFPPPPITLHINLLFTTQNYLLEASMEFPFSLWNVFIYNLETFLNYFYWWSLLIRQKQITSFLLFQIHHCWILLWRLAIAFFIYERTIPASSMPSYNYSSTPPCSQTPPTRLTNLYGSICLSLIWNEFHSHLAFISDFSICGFGHCSFSLFPRLPSLPQFHLPYISLLPPIPEQPPSSNHSSPTWHHPSITPLFFIHATYFSKRS